MLIANWYSPALVQDAILLQVVRLAVIHRNEQVRRPGGAEGEEEEERKDYFAHGMKVVQETQKSGRECGAFIMTFMKLILPWKQ